MDLEGVVMWRYGFREGVCGQVELKSGERDGFREGFGHGGGVVMWSGARVGREI